MQAIVLSRRDVREYDQIVTFYTCEDGKIDLLAKGIKKITSKNAAILSPFFLVDIDYVGGKDLPRLTTVQQVETFDRLSSNLANIKLMAKSLDLINRVFRQEHDRKIFDGLVEWLRLLNNEAEVHQAIFDTFVLKLWALLGFKMVIERCVSCGSVSVENISVASGGVVCKMCAVVKKKDGEIVFPINKSERVLLRKMFEQPLKVINRSLKLEWLPDIHTIIYNFVIFHSHQPLADWGKVS